MVSACRPSRHRLSLAAVVPSLSLLMLPMAGTPAVQPVSATAQVTVAKVSDERPNIVVLMADDMREDDLVFMARTRRILVRNGLHFRNSFAPDPLCCPSRASFLTGRDSHNHRVMSHKRPWGFRAFDDSFTISTALKRSGYRTALVGKYLNGYGSQSSRVTGGPSLHYAPAGYTDWYASVEPPKGSGVIGNTYNYLRVAYNHNGVIEDNHLGEYSTNGIGRISRRLISKYAAGSRPFFVYSSFVAPHNGGPLEADDPIWDVPCVAARGFRFSGASPVGAGPVQWPGETRSWPAQGRWTRRVEHQRQAPVPGAAIGAEPHGSVPRCGT